MDKISIEDILELDSKRTQGEWRVGGTKKHPHCSVHSDSRQIHHPLTGCGVDFYRNHPAQEFRDALCNDAAFIASAPRMVEIIRQQKAQIEEMEELLEECVFGMSGILVAKDEYSSLWFGLTDSKTDIEIAREYLEQLLKKLTRE